MYVGILLYHENFICANSHDMLEHCTNSRRAPYFISVLVDWIKEQNDHDDNYIISGGGMVSGPATISIFKSNYCA